ncbi:transposase [Adonisia turfae]|uniref:Transposase n=1 Tax=Adonisia turfae CCMR0081 TaxID=2292702 RepID=A0A6M0RDX5_9CYAN|nr:transposase [Adonisia turfae]NEZ54130.1 transposase [Adonisia turfae CCMR0081]
MTLSHEKCVALLEKIRWNSTPKCPYCGSTKSTAIRQERRHHCNNCFNSYSVTVGTIFHGSRVPLHKWFKAIHMYLDNSLTPRRLSVRALAKEIHVNKNTAASMLKRMRSCLSSKPAYLKAILRIELEPKDESE